MIATFKQKASAYQLEADRLSRQYNRFSFIRLISFALALIALIFFANERNGEAIIVLVLVFPVLFGLLIKKHNQITYKRDHARFLNRINQDEISKHRGELKKFDGGDEFIDPLHPYTGDLDVFGKNSLFQLLDRTTTVSGKALLAAWLKEGADQQEISERHEAIKALKDQVEWRQNFQASGMHFEDPKSQIHTFIHWLNTSYTPKNPGLYKFGAYILAIAVVLAVISNFYFGLSFYYTAGLLVVNGYVLKTILERVKNTTEETYESIKALKAYAALIGQIENTDFTAARLKLLYSDFKHDHFKASKAIGQLHRILDNLQARSNFFYLFFNFFLLADVHLLLQAENWKKKYHKEVDRWFDSISQFEVINSLAGFAHAHPEYVFPNISETPYQWNAKALGHPLIKQAERVSNDFAMDGKGKVVIITGSNMSGKSTFLRTIGINTVMALMGAPVCAGAMTVAAFQVFTGMRTQDNLEESVSSFYAELKRIKQLLDMLENNQVPVLFMLDEILKGTNSKDRHLGAVALVKQLGGKQAMGFVSTHDLELGELAKQRDNIDNYSFNSSIINQEIHFDYRLTQGVCKSFNASKLMEKMGIDIHK